jgi:hypothetical protein
MPMFVNPNVELLPLSAGPGPERFCIRCPQSQLRERLELDANFGVVELRSRSSGRSAALRSNRPSNARASISDIAGVDVTPA